MKKHQDLNFKKLFLESWQEYKKHASSLVRIIMLGVVIALVGVMVSAIFLAPAVLSYSTGNLILAVILGIIGIILAIITLFLSQNWPYIAILKFVSNNKLSVTDSYRQTLSLVIPFIWITLLSAAIVFGGILLLIIPGIIASIWVMFGVFIMIFENKRGLEALKQSKAYVTGYWWDIFVIQILMMLVTLGIFIAPSIIIEYYKVEALNFLMQLFINFVWIPFGTVFSYKLYLTVKKLPRNKPSDTPTLQILAGLGALIVIVLLLLLGTLLQNPNFQDNDPGAYPNVQLEDLNQV